MIKFDGLMTKLDIVQRFSKTLRLPACAGLSVYDLLYFLVIESQKNALTMRASAAAFTFFLALFPAIIFFFTLIPFLPIANLHAQLLQEMQTFLPHNAYDAAVTTINDLVQNQHNGLLSFGFLITLYFSTNGINALIDAFNQILHHSETRGFFQQRLVSLLLLIGLSLLVITASVLIIFSELAINYALAQGVLLSDGLVLLLLTIGKWLIAFLLLFVAIYTLYYFGPVKSEHRCITQGAVLATVLSIAASLLFNYYVNNFGTYNKIYGSIGTVMVIMLWLQFNCLTLLIGFDWNAKISRLSGTQ